MIEGNVSDEVLRAIRRILRKTAEHSRHVFRAAGLTVPQLLCLRAIAEAKNDTDVTVAMVSQSVQLAPATVSRILDRLEAAELIIRERRSKDRRKVCLSLTAAGRERLRDLPPPLQEQFVDRLSTLPPDEQRQLLDALRKVVDLMEARDIEAAPVLEPGVELGLRSNDRFTAGRRPS